MADGDPDGLRLVERSNWIGKLLKIAPFSVLDMPSVLRRCPLCCGCGVRLHLRLSLRTWMLGCHKRALFLSSTAVRSL